MKVLLVEDDVSLSAALAMVLEANQYSIDQVADGRLGLEQAMAIAYDLIVLDVHLPTLDGLSLCRQLRSQGYCHPIMLLTANGTDAAAIAGFEAGADDYITKPVAAEVLLARMRTLLRRSQAHLQADPAAAANRVLSRDAGHCLIWGALCLDRDAGRVTVEEQVVPLTATEFNLLELFLRNPDRIFSRGAILDRLWGYEDAPSDRAVITYVKEVRKKLKATGLTDDLIETVYGMGYRLKPTPPLFDRQAGKVAKKPLAGVSVDPRTAIDRLKPLQNMVQPQIAVLMQAQLALLETPFQPKLLQAAQREAHKLAGSLGSFGCPMGSRLARSIEHLLLNSSTASEELPPSIRASALSADEVGRFGELLEALQHELALWSAVPECLPLPIPQARVVWLVDDDTVLAERLMAESKHWEVQIRVFSHPAIARMQLALSLPDGIVLGMADAADAGWVLLQELAEQSPDLPVIVLTGCNSLADRLTASRLGARQYLHKPATSEQIFQAIAHVLSRRQTAEAKVLIVDDDPTMLALLSSMLTPWGVDIVTLHDPQHFWNVLLATSPNVVLLDLEMPQINGLELCRVVRQDHQWGDLPILVVTAHTDAESLQRAFAAGADDFITKPVLGPELVSRVLSRIERTRPSWRLVSRL